MAEKDNSTKFYCYAHRTADTNHVFYIGKGHGNRAYSKQRSKYWHNKANKHGYTVEIIATGLTERQAFDMEREFIAFYGRDKLVNLTDGGEGSSGLKRIFSESHCKKISIAAIGRIRTPEAIEKTASKLRGIKHTKERIANRAEKQRGKKMPESMKQKISELHKGKVISEKQKNEITEKLGKRVLCSNGMIFKSIGEAQRWLISEGLEKAAFQSISRCCNKNSGSAYGYRWEFVK